MMKIIRQFLVESRDIRFEGNGYSEEWHREASRRGLKAINSVPDAYKELISPESVKMFEEQGILSEREAHARYEVLNETYIKKLQIEARVMGDLTTNHVIPTAISFQNSLVENVKGIKELFPDDYAELCKTQLNMIRKISGYVNQLHLYVHDLVEARKVANVIEDIPRKSEAYYSTVFPYMDKIRTVVDKLEMVIDDELWPLPKYREMLFFR